MTRLWPFVRGRPPYPSPPNKASLPIAASNRRGSCWAPRKDREIRSNVARVLDRLAINYELREHCERSVVFALMIRNLLTKSAIRERAVFATSCFIREPPMTVLLRSGVLLSRSAAMNSGPMWGITKSSGWWQNTAPICLFLEEERSPQRDRTAREPEGAEPVLSQCMWNKQISRVFCPTSTQALW